MTARTIPLTLAMMSCFLGFTCITSSAHARNTQGPYSVEVVMNGVAQPVYHNNGQSYVAGAYGSAYEILVHNRTGRRIEAIVAVDGRDVVTGQPVRPRHHRGYIVAPFSSTSIDGFRSSTASVAAFRFSTIPESYAWRTGTSWGIGTIRVWIFEEQAPVVVRPPVLPYGGSRSRTSRPAPGMSGDMAAEAAPQTMGTSYGEQRWSPVGYTTFVRQSSRAQARLDIRYNSYEMLAAAGIISPTPYPVYYPVPCRGYCYGPTTFAPPPPPVQFPRRHYAQ